MRDLSKFTNDYDRGKPKIIQYLWVFVSEILFQSVLFPPRWRPPTLRLFGGVIGSDVLIRHRVRIMWPWKLTIGNSVWIGEGAWFVNLENIEIGNNVCVSQGVFLCTGSHDFRMKDFRYANKPIELGEGSWIAAQAIVLPGVIVGTCSVVGAGEVVRRDVPAYHSLVSGTLKKIGLPI